MEFLILSRHIIKSYEYKYCVATEDNEIEQRARPCKYENLIHDKCGTKIQGRTINFKVKDIREQSFTLWRTV